MNTYMILKSKSLYIQIIIPLVFFAIAALYGLLLRLQMVSPIFSANYINIVQAHSHVTFLGWVFLSVITFIFFFFIPNTAISNFVLKRTWLQYSYWIMVVTLVGMLVSFPIQGYKLFSILFLTVFLLASYVYLFVLYKQILHVKTTSVRFIRMGIIYYYISSIGIWALSIITVKIGKGELYQHAISFYTHFLYNGFFVLSLFGLFFRYFEIRKIQLSQKIVMRFFLATNTAVIPTFALSLLWVSVPVYVVLIGFVGAILQLISILFLKDLVKEILRKKQLAQRLSYFLLKFLVVSYFIKLVFQFLGAFPNITKIALAYKSFFVIGYIHLFTLGFLSLFIFLLHQLFLKRVLNKWGVYLLVAGIFTSEILLFAQGLLYYFEKNIINNYNESMLIASAFMTAGILMILFFSPKENRIKK